MPSRKEVKLLGTLLNKVVTGTMERIPLSWHHPHSTPQAKQKKTATKNFELELAYFVLSCRVSLCAVLPV